MHMSDPKNNQAMNKTTEIHHQQPPGCYAPKTGFYQCILYYIVGI